MTPNAHIRQIIAMVAEHHRVKPEDILSRRLDRPAVYARHDAIKAVHMAKPHFSLSRIGRLFGRDHSTVCYALGRLKKCRERRK